MKTAGEMNGFEILILLLLKIRSIFYILRFVDVLGHLSIT